MSPRSLPAGGRSPNPRWATAIRCVRLWLLFALCVPSLAQQNTVDPRSAADLITQVNTLAQLCGFRCTIHIPAGEYTVHAGTILIHHNGLSLIGEGRNSTIIHYAGTNFLDARLDAQTYGASFQGGGTIGGFTLYCTNAQVRCITSGSILGERWQELSVFGPGGITGAPPPGSNAEGFVLQNTFNWTERTVFRDIMIGGFNANFHFKAPIAPGVESFGYSLFDGIWTNQSTGSKNFQIDYGASVYNVLGFTMQFNSQGTTVADEVFSIGGTFTGVGFHVTGENTGALMTFAHIACSGAMQFSGDYMIFYGEVVSDCVQGKEHTREPFRVTPVAGLAGVRGSLSGNALIPGFTALGELPAQTLRLYPSTPFNLVNPNANAYTGFVANAIGRVAPISVFDPEVPWCVATRLAYRQPGEITPRLCLDGAGNLAASGVLRAPAVVTTRGTPATSHEVCTPGESWDDDNFHYHCTSAGQIKRLALGAF